VVSIIVQNLVTIDAVIWMIMEVSIYWLIWLENVPSCPKIGGFKAVLPPKWATISMNPL